MAARSKTWVCGRSLAGFEGSNPAGGMGVSIVSVVCCQVEISATGRSLVQRSRTKCGVFKAGITRYSPVSERAEGELAMPVTRSKEEAGQ